MACFGIKCFQYMICEALSWSAFQFVHVFVACGQETLGTKPKRAAKPRVPAACYRLSAHFFGRSQVKPCQRSNMLCYVCSILFCFCCGSGVCVSEPCLPMCGRWPGCRTWQSRRLTPIRSRSSTCGLAAKESLRSEMPATLRQGAANSFRITVIHFVAGQCWNRAYLFVNVAPVAGNIASVRK